MKTSAQNLKLSAAGKMLVSLSLAYMGSAAVAANIEAIGDTQVTQKGRVDVVNIVAPNAHGLSHNQYNKYNVAKEGAVLNNALQAGQSQLAGQLEANRNLSDKAAAVILNEVVTKNPSLILGKQEVFGIAADYVLANPNGITYKGGSVINAPRASFVVGQAEIENGRLASFATGLNNSAARLEVTGNVEGSNILDFIAPKVAVNGNVSAEKAVNVVSGSNRVGYEDGNVEALERGANAPVLDGSVYGSIRSGAIRIHATDSRGKQHIQGNLAAKTDLTVKSANNLDVKASNLASEQDMTLDAKNTTVDGILVKNQPTSTGVAAPVVAPAPAAVASTTAAKNVKFLNNLRGRTANRGSRAAAAQRARNAQILAAQANHAARLAQSQSASTKGSDGVVRSNTSSGSTQSYQASSITAGGRLTLNNTGNLNLQAVKIEAGSLELAAANLGTSTVKTVETKSADSRNSKGLWYNNSRTDARDETVHATSIKVANDAVIDTANVNLSGAQVNVGNNLKLVGKNSLRLQGVVSTDTESTRVDFKNETAALKTGYSTKDHSLQSFHATQITAGGDVLLKTDNTLHATGAKVHAAGNLLAEVKHLNLDTHSTTDRANADDKQKYWGGIGGGKDGRTNIVNETLHGAALTSGGETMVKSTNGVKVRGSAVKGAQGAFVDAGNGRADIANAIATNQQQSHERVGTVFNITKKRTDTQSNVQTSTGSVLASDANVQLVAEKDILVKGSRLDATRNLTVTSNAGNVGIVAAATQSQYNNSSFSIGGKATAKVTPPKVTLPEVPGIVISDVKMVDGQLKGKIAPPKMIDPTVKGTAGLGIVVTKATDNTNVTKHEGSALNAENINVTAVAGKKAGGNVNIAGSSLNAKEKVTVVAEKDINVTAVKDVVDSNATKRVTDIGITGTATAGIGSTPKASVKFGIDSGYNNTHSVSSNASVSAIGGKQVELDAVTGSITHEGTKLNGTASVTERGKNVTHAAAENTVHTNVVEHKGGISLTLGASAKKAFDAKLAVHGSGGTSTENQKTATVAEVSGGEVSVVTNNGNVVDEGTKYNATGNLHIETDSYTNTAAVASNSKVSNKGGAELYVAAGTSDFATIDASVGGNVSYQHGKNNSTTSSKGTLNGKNVIINANKGAATIAADVNAVEDVSIKANKGVTFTESKDTVNNVSGGFGLGGSVGVKIIPEAGVVVPSSVSVNANVNYGKKDAVKGTGSNVQAGNDITLDGNTNVDLQGTNVVAKNNVSIKGDKVSSSSALTTNNEIDLGVGGSLGLGLGDSEDPIRAVKVGVDVDVKRDKEHTHTINVIKGGNEVSIAGNFQGSGVKLTGTDVIGSKVDITNANPNGTVEMTGVTSSSSSFNVGVGVNVGGNLDIDKWTEQEVRTWLDRCGYPHVEVTEKEHIRKIWNLHGGGRFNFGGKVGGGGGGGKIVITPKPDPKPTPSNELPPPPVVEQPEIPTPPAPPAETEVPPAPPVTNEVPPAPHTPEAPGNQDFADFDV